MKLTETLGPTQCKRKPAYITLAFWRRRRRGKDKNSIGQGRKLLGKIALN